MYSANGYSVSLLVKRPRYRRVIAQLVAIGGGGVISRTPRGPSELLRRSGFGRSGTPCSPPFRRRGGGILFLPVQSCGGVDSSPEWLLHSETHGSRSSSSNPSAAPFHKLRLVPLLPASWSSPMNSLMYKDNWTGIPGLGIPHLRVVPIPIIYTYKKSTGRFLYAVFNGPKKSIRVGLILIP
jgi:hypothetical protein